MATKSVTIRMETVIEYTVAVNDSGDSDVRGAVRDYIRGLNSCDNEHLASIQYPMLVIKNRRVKFDTTILSVLSIGNK